MKPNLEQYLKENYEKGIIDHSIRVSHVDQSGKPHFYIHPHGYDGDTLDFVVNDNWITQKYIGSDKFINVNGREKVTQADILSYDEVVSLAGLKNGVYSVVWSVKNGRSAILMPNQVVSVVDGMVINIQQTNNA